MRWPEILCEINYLPPNKQDYIIERHYRWLDKIRGKHPRSRKFDPTTQQLKKLETLIAKLMTLIGVHGNPN